VYVVKDINGPNVYSVHEGIASLIYRYGGIQASPKCLTNWYFPSDDSIVAMRILAEMDPEVNKCWNCGVPNVSEYCHSCGELQTY
jgi:hypothetical protein